MNILTLITFLPAVGAVALMLLPRNDKMLRWAALLISLATFAASLVLPLNFKFSDTQPFQFEINANWISAANIHYHLGADGISMWLVVLTTFLVPLSILVSWKSIHDRVKEFFVLILLLEMAMIGVFLALDMFLFYVFWEATLIPMALLIGMYGHERRIYAAVKFFLYTMVASVFMLAATIWLYVHNPQHNFEYEAFRQVIASGAVSPSVLQWLFLGFFIAFAVKVPLFPLHTWLPDAHVEAPTAGSVLLAGVLLKMGTYGLLRFNVGMFPQQAANNSSWINTLAVIGIIYGALVALVQPNLKKLIAYSSVSHLGFVVLGIFSLTTIGTDGAVYQMLNHGISTGALFMLAGMLYERKHTYEFKEFGGLATPMPVYATFFLLAVLSSVGLPLLNGFVGEFLVLSGTFQSAMAHHVLFSVLATSGVIWGACYLLWMYQKVFYGQIHHAENKTLSDIDGRERISLVPLVIMSVIMGVASPYWMKAIEPSVVATMASPAAPATIQSQNQNHVLHSRMDQFRPAETVSMNSVSPAEHKGSSAEQKTGGPK